MSEPVKVAPRGYDGIGGGKYAEAGEKTYCRNGHFLGRIVRDVTVGQEADAADFRLAPGSSLFMSICPHCKADVTDGVGVYFFEVETPNPEIQR